MKIVLYCYDVLKNSLFFPGLSDSLPSGCNLPNSFSLSPAGVVSDSRSAQFGIDSFTYYQLVPVDYSLVFSGLLPDLILFFLFLTFIYLFNKLYD